MNYKFKQRVISSFLSLALIFPAMSVRAGAEPVSWQVSDAAAYAREAAVKLAQASAPKALDLELPDQADPDSEIRVIVEFEAVPDGVSRLQTGISTLARIESQQELFHQQADRSGVAYEPVFSFRQIFNGVSLVTRRKDIPALGAMSGVKRVVPAMTYERPEPLRMDSAADVAAPYAWDLGYKGEGLTVAVLDSGFDTSHPDFKLSDPALAELNRAQVMAKGLRGSYRSSKFPYGWNYYDDTSDLYEEGFSHGQHVAGSVGANGRIRGVAPEAQLLAMRVFSDDPAITTTSEDVYLKAMEDAVILGADVLNLSLGAPAGFSYDFPRPIETAIANANDAGAVVVMAVGNDRNMVLGSDQKASSWMPDQGLVSSPAVEADSLAVAAADTLSDMPRIASFSSWGATNDLRLKPEITAPGFVIESTQNDGGYDWMSGTSVATPHVAGGTAVLRDYLADQQVFGPVAEQDTAAFIKTLLMNSARLIIEDGAVRSPRVQGAGMMDLERAIRARTLAVGTASKEAKIELGEFTDPSFRLDLQVTNHGSLIRTYKATVILLTDEIDAAGTYTEISRPVTFTCSGDQSFSLTGNSASDISLAIDFSADEVPEDQFIEGFVILTDQMGEDTTVPFMGFYGDWDRPLILDRFMEGETSGTDPLGASFFGFSGLLGYSPAKDEFHQHSNRLLALNPGTLISEVNGTGTIYPVLSFLRSAQRVEFNILDEAGQLIHPIGSASYIHKIHRIYAQEPMAAFIDAGTWDGSVAGGVIAEGRYYYELKAAINAEEATPQSRRIPMIIDYTGPVITEFYLEGNELVASASDGAPDRTAGILDLYVSLGAEGDAADVRMSSEDGATYRADITPFLEQGLSLVYILGFDRLYNSSVQAVPLQAPSPEITRLAGSNRYKTAVEISNHTMDQADRVIIVSGTSIPDSLAAGPLSVQLGAPILLANPRGLTEEVKTEILRLQALEAIIIGGEAAVSAAAADELAGLGLTVRRLGGANRYETSMLVDAEVRSISGSSGPAIIANGLILVDALAMGPVAGGMGVGILFNNGTSITRIQDALAERDRVILLGGLASENAEVEAQLLDLGIELERIAGANRRSTAVAIAQRFCESPDSIVVANDRVPFDALAGTILSFSNEAPILLNPAEQLRAENSDYITGAAIRSAFILGGAASISEAAEQQLELLLN